MNALELKGSLHDLIAKVNDASLLAELHSLIHEFIQQKKDDPDWWDELTPEQQQELQMAIDESYNENSLVTDEEAQAMIQQWLNK